MRDLEVVLEEARAEERTATAAVGDATQAEVKAEQLAAFEGIELRELEAKLLLADVRGKAFPELVKARIEGRAKVEALDAGLERARAARAAAQTAAVEAGQRTMAAELEIRRRNIAAQGDQLTAKVEGMLDQLKKDLVHHNAEWERGCSLSRQLGLHPEPCRRTFWLSAALEARANRGGFMFQEIGRAVEGAADYRRNRAQQAAEEASIEARRQRPPPPPETPRGPSSAMVEALAAKRRPGPAAHDFDPQLG